MAHKGLIGPSDDGLPVEPRTEPLLATGRYRVRLGAGAGDLDRALALRTRLFRGRLGAADADAFDPLCRHLLVERVATGELVCTCRLLDLADGSRIGESYSAQFYDLAALSGFRGPMIEIGRFCIAPEARDADVLRLAWGAIARIVEGEGVEMLFGCSSFQEAREAEILGAFALLADRHIAPPKWRPRVKAPEVVGFARGASHPRGLKTALKAMPPLLRSYLSMGGWLSDHAVRDRDLATLHVFTGLEVNQVPMSRKRALRGLAGA